MPQDPIINNSQREVVNTARVLIRSAGLSALKTKLYLPGITAAEIQANKPTSKPDLALPEETGTDDRGLGRSEFGTIILSNLEIQPGSYTKNGTIYRFGDNVSLPIKFPVVIMTIQMTKNIVATPIQGRDGTVKEYVSDGDYVINVKGRFDNSNGAYPQNQMIELAKALRAPVPLKINSWFLLLLGIDTIVVQSMDIPQEEGGYSKQLWEFNALSDTSFEIAATQ